MRFTKIIKSEKGFSLIELMVVLVIMVALTMLVLAGYSETGPRLAAERAVESFIGDIYKARSRNIGAHSQIDNEEILTFNHGVYLESGDESYIIFADKNENKEYSTGEDVETVDVERGASILEIEVGGTPETSVSVVFSEKGEEVFFNGQANSSASISFGYGSIQRTVEINSSGIVSVIQDF